MLVNNVTTGFVVQVFDTELKRFISQEFTAGEQTDYEDRLGDPVDRKLLEVDGQEAYLPFDMVQPKTEDAIGRIHPRSTSMRLNIEIDGAAVEGDANAKTASILRKFANALETYTARPYKEWQLWDDDGNVVGMAEVVGQEHPVRIDPDKIEF
jgi:hypothetical protein